ncbi:protein kinase [bacterium]|nr:protein kinase [bacterium]
METMLLDNFSTSISKIDDLLKKGGFLGDRYIILESLATGGMGHVFRAKDTTLDEIVVLKILKADLALEKDMLSRFKREIKVARKVKHPNVCTIYDFGNFDDIFFISMEYIHGTDLSDLIEENKVQRERILPYARGILNALGAAHSEKIIHRDLKPSNIKIDNQDKPVILDFGIARYIGIPDLTGHEEILGTPAYMSPEQFKGEKIDQRTDIYAFGIILYEMYVGHIPFSGASPIEVAMKHLQEPPVPLRTIDPTINPELEAIVLKCMRKDPDERYQNVDEILADLDRLDTHDTGATETQSKVRPATVLIADDDEDIRKLLNTILLNNGYGTLIAQSGEQAIDLAINNKPDLICMDLMMPGMDGYQAVEFLQANPQTRGIPIVMITCKQDKEYRAYGKSIGVKEYITKPFDINKLLNNIKKIVPPTTSRP